MEERKEEINDGVTEDNRITIGAAVNPDYSKIITGGNEVIEDGIPLPEKKELTDEEIRELKLKALKNSIRRSTPKKTYGLQYRAHRQKKNKMAGKSRAKNR